MRVGVWVLGMELVALAWNEEPESMVVPDRGTVSAAGLQAELSPTLGFENPWRHTECDESHDNVALGIGTN